MGLCRVLSEGRASVVNAGKYGFINQTGEVVINTEWDCAMSFAKGLFTPSGVRDSGASLTCLESLSFHCDGMRSEIALPTI